MEKEDFISAGEYFIRLLRARLGVKNPPFKKPEGVSWQFLFSFAEKHSLTALVWESLKANGEEPDKETAGKWKQAYHACVYADATQLFSWEEIKGRTDGQRV